ncbi:unnamed protein product [Zymoseptoria tritici ST99CH_3D7]|uniref:NACHT domain-containing protein n=1 Tax=Zymoseptoria tritici (strain ST99CH_3D7) TaxID=1276538 RepID=A0A1X7S0C6_ZYMT9|nr:unnamed protein product [Zymoseptoria tritici ST99CH_3D7]
MDPATIVGLIASVVTIVEFTTDVVRESHDLVRSGRKPTSVRIAEVVKCQQDACQRLLVDIAKDEAIERKKTAENIAQGRSSRIELEQSPSLSQLAKSCVEEASLLTKTLNSLAVKARNDGTMSLGAALWSVGRARMKKKDIEDAQRKLQANIGNLLLHTISRAQKNNATTTNDLIQSVSSNQTSTIELAIADLKATSEAHATEQTNLLAELRDSVGGEYDRITSAQPSNAAGPFGPGPELDQVLLESQLGTLDQLDHNKAALEAKACAHILQSLDFSERSRRQMAIQDAHHDTFDWMFEPGSSPIQDWANSPRGIFWINGKAGSGKSTLMKYISGNRKTKALLREWALQVSDDSISANATDPLLRNWALQESSTSVPASILTESLLRDWASPKSRELVAASVSTMSLSDLNTQQVRLTIVDIYFWYLGTDLQKSEEGLLKSMLYQILHDSREPLPVACPNRWVSVRKAIETADVRELDLHLDAASVPWTCFELRAALDRVAECTSDRRFAFFIDGLDEYDADQTALIKLIQKLARNPNFKFCVSSRPWNVFINAFTSHQDMFILEELTRNDIWKYVHAELAPNVLNENQSELELLCAEVVDKAQGVFLWVFLAVRSLKEGLEENDDIRILRQRLQELPADLEEYFDVILSRVHKVYRNLTATALYILHRAVQLQNQDTVWKLTDGHHRSFLNIWLLKQGMEAEDFALKQEIVDVDVPKCHDMVIQTSRFISACCKDLLCVPKPPPAGNSDEQTYMTQYKVEFLHRTVFEYLNGSRILGRLQSSAIPHVGGPQFDVMSALARLSFVPIHSAGRLRFLK